MQVPEALSFRESAPTWRRRCGGCSAGSGAGVRGCPSSSGAVYGQGTRARRGASRVAVSAALHRAGQGLEPARRASVGLDAWRTVGVAAERVAVWDTAVTGGEPKSFQQVCAKPAANRRSCRVTAGGGFATTLRLIELRRSRYRAATTWSICRSSTDSFRRRLRWAGELRTVVTARATCSACRSSSILRCRRLRSPRRRGLHRGREEPSSSTAWRTCSLTSSPCTRSVRVTAGRASILAQLAADAGWTLRWAAMDPEENVQASRCAHRGDHRPLRDMLNGLVRPASMPPTPSTPTE